MNKQQGFTLIELMIVVAIIAILAAIAIPQYNDYTARAQLSEAFTLASGFKTPIAEAASQDGNANNFCKVPNNSVTSGKYVSTVTAVAQGDTGCKITAKMRADGVNKKVSNVELSLTFDPTKAGGKDLVWKCDSTAPDEVKPKACT